MFIDIVTPIWGGQVKFYAKWIECGQRPVWKGSALGRHVGYYEQSPVFTLWRDNHRLYFCTPKEAELEGLSNNPDYYDYPNLTQDEYQEMIRR